MAATIVNTAMGEVVLKTAPKRVITLEHRYSEMVLSLGIVPVGVADIESYKRYDGIDGGKLKGVHDVGRRAAPNLESIGLLKPDLIIGARLRNASVYPLLSKIAPTLLFSYIEPPSNGISPYDEMIDEYKRIAKVLNRQKQAEVVLSMLNETIVKAQAEIKRLKAEGRLTSDRVAIAQFLPGSPKIRLMTTDSVAIEALEKIGLKPAWNREAGLEGTGYETVSIDVLMRLGLFHLFYINERADDAELKKTMSSPIWQHMAFVEAGLTARMAEDIWPWGGPLAVKKLIEHVVDVLAKS